MPSLLTGESVALFSGAALQSQLDAVLNGLPDGHDTAELEFGQAGGGINVVAAVKLENGWALVGGVSYEAGTWSEQIKVRWSGK